MSKRIEVKDLNIYYGKFHAVSDVNLVVEPRSVTAFIGPSGCGKSTVLRTLNRMHEVIPGARCTGEVLLDGTDLYGPGVDPVAVRRVVGMVFQRHILVYMAMKKSLFLSFLFLTAQRYIKNMNYQTFS